MKYWNNTMDLERYQQLKSKIEETQRNQNQCEGALAQLMERLKDEFNCSSLKEAEVMEEELTGKIAQLEKKIKPLADEIEEILELKG